MSCTDSIVVNIGGHLVDRDRLIDEIQRCIYHENP